MDYVPNLPCRMCVDGVTDNACQIVDRERGAESGQNVIKAEYPLPIDINSTSSHGLAQRHDAVFLVRGPGLVRLGWGC